MGAAPLLFHREYHSILLSGFNSIPYAAAGHRDAVYRTISRTVLSQRWRLPSKVICTTINSIVSLNHDFLPEGHLLGQSHSEYMYQHDIGQKRFPMAAATFWEGIRVPACQ
jgi:hypothetical protein